MGAEQLLSAAGLGEEAIGRVAESIVNAAKAAAGASRGGPEVSAELRIPAPVRDAAEADARSQGAPTEEEEPVPPLSRPVSPGPSPPSPAEEGDAEPRPESDRNDDG